jgi:mannose-6-phosphate isomerase-like protein (cupin superfamily)
MRDEQEADCNHAASCSDSPLTAGPSGGASGPGVHVEPHSHANEQIAWMLKGKMEFRLGSEQRVCAPGDVVVIPGGIEHEAWFREDTEVIDFFAPPRHDFLVGGKPAYMSEG